MNSIKLVMISALISIISMSAFAEMPTMGNQQGNMPMMGNQQSNMPMMGNQQGNMPMMGNQQGNMPMMGNRQAMMHSMMSMKQQHMYQMQNRLANIEALLRELVAIQKANQTK